MRSRLLRLGGVAAITGTTTSAVFNTKNPLDATLGGAQDGFVALFDTSTSGANSLIYSTYLGGTSTENFVAVDIDSDENVYAFGDTSSNDYPVTGTAVQTVFGSSTDLVLSKISPLGDELLFSTYVSRGTFGSTGVDTARGLFVNDVGRAFGAGETTSSNMSTTGVIQTSKSTGIDGYFFQMSTVNEAPLEPTINAPVNGAIMYDTTPALSARYIDNDLNDVGTVHFRVSTGSALNCVNGASLVSSGTSAESATTNQVMYFTSSTLSQGTTYYWCAQSDDGELTSGAGYTTMGSFTVANISEFQASTYLGGDSNDIAAGIGFDTSGNVVVVGTSESDFPTTAGAFQETDPNLVSSESATVTKFNSALTSILVSTYVGGSSREEARHAKVDSTGKVYISGLTYSTDLPQPAIPNGFDLTRDDDGFGDVFLMVLNESIDTVLYSTYISGEDYDDQGGGIGVHSTNGRVFLTGTTYSSFFPTTAGAFDTVPDGSNENYNGDGFAMFIDTTQSGASSLIYSTFVGGANGFEWLYLPSMDTSGYGYVTGNTGSSDFPVTTGAFDETVDDSNGDGFLVKIDPAGNASTSLMYGTIIGGNNGGDETDSVTVDGTDVYVCGYTDSSDFITTLGTYSQTLNGTADNFVYHMNLAGNGVNDLVSGTFFGGTGNDYCADIIVESDGGITFLGYGSDGYSTTVGAFDESFNGTASSNVALTKMSPALDAVIYSTYFDGPNVASPSNANVLAQHSNGNIYFVGSTSATDFPAMGGYDSTFGDNASPGFDMYVAQLDLPAYSGPGPTVPDAIINLNATAGDEQVSLTWSAPADNGSAITDYVIEYGATSGFPGNAATFNDGTSAITGATVTGLTNDTEYSFRVAAVNGIGQGPYSNVDTATPTAGPAPQTDSDNAEISVDINDFLSFSIANLAGGDEAAGDQPFGSGGQITDLTSTGNNDYAISGEFGSPVYTRLETTTNSNDGYNVVAYAMNTGGRTNTLLRTGGTPGNAADEITDSLSRLPASQAANEALDTGTDSGLAFRLIDASTSSIIREADEDTQWGDGDAGTALWASFPLGSGAAQVIYDTVTFSSGATTAYINWFVGISPQQRSGSYSGQVTFTASVN